MEDVVPNTVIAGERAKIVIRVELPRALKYSDPEGRPYEVCVYRENVELARENFRPYIRRVLIGCLILSSFIATVYAIDANGSAKSNAYLLILNATDFLVVFWAFGSFSSVSAIVKARKPAESKVPFAKPSESSVLASVMIKYKGAEGLDWTPGWLTIGDGAVEFIGREYDFRIPREFINEFPKDSATMKVGGCSLVPDCKVTFGTFSDDQSFESRCDEIRPLILGLEEQGAVPLFPPTQFYQTWATWKFAFFGGCALTALAGLYFWHAFLQIEVKAQEPVDTRLVMISIVLILILWMFAAFKYRQRAKQYQRLLQEVQQNSA